MLTAIIPTYNEEENIKAAIESVSFADEILVIDSFSSDNTCAIAKAHQVNLVQHTFDTHALQKNRAIELAAHDWVFVLDADERVPDSLRKEIKEVLANPKKQAYWIFRENWFMGRRLNYSAIKNDKVVRLFRKDKGRYNLKSVHEEIDTTSVSVGVLKNRIVHNTYKSYYDFIKKLTRYGCKSGQGQLDKKVTTWHLIGKPLVRFCKHYIWGGGLRDGFPGLVFAYCNAHAVFSRYVYIKLNQKNDGKGINA